MVKLTHLGRVSVLLCGSVSVGAVDLGGGVAVLGALRVRTLLVHRSLLVVGLGFACIGMKVRIFALVYNQNQVLSDKMNCSERSAEKLFESSSTLLWQHCTGRITHRAAGLVHKSNSQKTVITTFCSTVDVVT